MGLFSKLFSHSGKQPSNEILSRNIELPPCKTEQELIERYGGIALEKQLDFGEVIGTNNWNVDMTKGTISFGQDLSFSMQVLGTISHSTQTWLWAWANTRSGLADSIIQQSLQLRKYGEDNGIDLLRSYTFDFSKEKLHLIGVIATGMFNASGYYIADYGQGAMVVTIQTGVVDKAGADKQHRIQSVFPQLISQFDLNHQNAFKNYLLAKEFSVTETKNTLTGTKNGITITGQFDEFSRLTSLH